MPPKGTGCREDSFKFKACYNIGMFAITKSIVNTGIKRAGSLGQYYSPESMAYFKGTA